MRHPIAELEEPIGNGEEPTEDPFLSRWLIDYLPRAGEGTKKERLMFQISLSQCWKGGSWATERFEELSGLAAARPDLKQAYDEVVAEEIPDWRREDSESEIVRSRQEALQMEATLKGFARDLSAIRTGQHDGWLAWAANIYFAESEDLDASISPRERLDTVSSTSKTFGTNGWRWDL
jgi:hypothetical protein